MGMIKLPEESINFFNNNLDEIFTSGNLAEGPWNKKISDFVKELTGAHTALPTNSNGAGMVALLTIYRHYFGRTNVLIQSNTMYGVKTMMYAGGCELVGFIKCRIESLMPSIQDVQNAICSLDQKEKDKLVIIFSHIGGIINPDIQAIAKLCLDENIILFEDCAHSFGSTLYGKHSGLFGNAGVYSFYATKAIPAGEGGVVVTNDQLLGEMISSFSIYDRFKQKLEIGNNIRVSEIQALFLYSVIKEWNEIIQNKKKIAEKYIDACINNNINYISQTDTGQNGNYYKFIIYILDGKISKVFSHLKTKTSAVYDYSIGIPNLVADKHVCLPIWYGQKDHITNQVIKEINYSFIKQ
jgi:dTDP-4-amino-4,6-dideoxygalactose transaminase